MHTEPWNLIWLITFQDHALLQERNQQLEAKQSSLELKITQLGMELDKERRKLDDINRKYQGMQFAFHILMSRYLYCKLYIFSIVLTTVLISRWTDDGVIYSRRAGHFKSGQG